MDLVTLKALGEMFNIIGPAATFALLMYLLLLKFEKRHSKERELWMQMSIKEREERAKMRREDDSLMRQTLENMTKTVDARAAETNAVILGLTKAVAESSAKQEAYHHISPVKTAPRRAPKRGHANA